MRLIMFAAALGVFGCSAATGVDAAGGLDPRLDPIFVTRGRWADVGRTCTDADVGVSVPASRSVAYSHGSDDRWAAIARTVPGGFGGILLNHNQYTVYLVDTSRFARAAAALEAAGMVRPTAVLKGRWDFGQMFDWAGVVLHGSQPLPGPTSFDINEATNRLEFGVADSAGLSAFDKAFAAMDLPCRLIWLKIEPAPVLTNF